MDMVRDDEVNTEVPQWVHFEAYIGSVERDALLCELGHDGEDPRRGLYMVRLNGTWALTTDVELHQAMLTAREET